MRYSKLTMDERETLEEGYKNHLKSHVRQRFKAILLSDDGWQVKDIAEIFKVRTRTIYTWMDRWESFGIAGLMILSGRGMKPSLPIEDEIIVETVKKKAATCARNLKQLALELSELLGIKVSKKMLQRFLKNLGYTWKRFRKSLKKKQDPIEYERKLSQLKEILKLYQSGYIGLFFGDQSTFNMEGYVPYGWQPKGQYIEITPAKTKGTQVFGLMSLSDELYSYTYKGSANSALIISFLDDFQTIITKPTVVVLDNAPIHTSMAFQEKIEKWKENDLYVFFLPTYSPHLNPIEILWRMIKYQWLPYEIIESQDVLDQMLHQILRSFGSEYIINFKEQKKVSIIYR